ncbi:hypothetical protein D3C76_1171990 [compost metagenome]
MTIGEQQQFQIAQCFDRHIGVGAKLMPQRQCRPKRLIEQHTLIIGFRIEQPRPTLHCRFASQTLR